MQISYCPTFGNIIRLLLPFKYPINPATCDIILLWHFNYPPFDFLPLQLAGRSFIIIQTEFFVLFIGNSLIRTPPLWRGFRLHEKSACVCKTATHALKVKLLRLFVSAVFSGFRRFFFRLLSFGFLLFRSLRSLFLLRFFGKLRLILALFFFVVQPFLFALCL